MAKKITTMIKCIPKLYTTIKKVIVVRIQIRIRFYLPTEMVLSAMVVPVVIPITAITSLPVLDKQNNFENMDCDGVCANDITTDRYKFNPMLSQKNESTSTNNQEELHNNRKHDTAPFSLSTHSYDKETPKIINSATPHMK